MSLDVYLESDTPFKRPASSGIFIRENGQTKEISQEEWDRRNPGREACRVVSDETETTRLYHGNITHNLNEMAENAGIYGVVWRPDECGVTKAMQMIGPLMRGLTALTADPEYFKKFNPSNGWGSYEVLIGFLQEYLDACRAHPQANVRVWR